MGKILLTGVDGNLGGMAAEYLLTLEKPENLIFCGYNPKNLEKYRVMGVEVRMTNFNHYEGLEEAFAGADAVGLISMPFVGEKRQAAQKNAVDAAKAAGVRQMVYTSLVNAGDESNPSIEKKDHIYTERLIEKSGMDYIFLRNSQYAEAMITSFFAAHDSNTMVNSSQGDGLMAYISRRDCAKAMAYALHRGREEKYKKRILNINGIRLMTLKEFIAIGNQTTGYDVKILEMTDEESYASCARLGIPRTTDGEFKNMNAPFSADGMVTFAMAIREGKMAECTKDFQNLTGSDPASVEYMFAHASQYQIGARHSMDK